MPAASVIILSIYEAVAQVCAVEALTVLILVFSVSHCALQQGKYSAPLGTLPTSTCPSGSGGCFFEGERIQWTLGPGDGGCRTRDSWEILWSHLIKYL